MLRLTGPRPWLSRSEKDELVPDETEATAIVDPVGGLIQAQQLAARVAGSIDLQNIQIRDLHWTMPDVDVEAGLPVNLEPQFELMIGRGPDAIVFRVRSTVPGRIPDGTEIFRFQAVHQIAYAIQPEAEAEEAFGPEELQAFGSTAVLMTAYPYVRQVLQSTAAQSNMPAVVLPLLRLPLMPQPPGRQQHPETQP